MPETPTHRCPSCGKRYRINAHHEGQTYRCKTCRVALVAEPADGPADQTGTPPAQLAAAVRRVLSDYAKAVPGHDLGDVGADVTRLRVRDGHLYMVRVAVLTETRVAEWVWEGAGGRPAPADLVKTFPTPPSLPPEPPPAPPPPPVSTEPIVCADCGGKKMVRCGRCQGTERVPCKHCDASGSYKCGNCNGTGMVVRPHRHSGYDTRASCSICHGKGVITCHVCAGTSRSPCPACPPKGPKVGGRVECPTCLGRGIVRPQPPKPPPPHPAAVERDPWQVDRPPAVEFVERSETWVVEGSVLLTVTCQGCKGVPISRCMGCNNSGSVKCPICDGKGLRYCSSCDTLGCDECDNTGYGEEECRACNGRKVTACKACGGKVPKPCRVCAGQLRYSRQLVVRREIVPFEREVLVGDVPSPDEAFRDWDLSKDFARVPRGECHAEWKRLAAGNLALVCQGSDAPTSVRQTIAAVAAELPDIGDRRRLIPDLCEVRIVRAEAIHARYVYDGEEFECWLLGDGHRLHAPDNPIARVLIDRLKEVCELAADGRRRPAARLLQTCRDMAAADPFCARRLDAAADELPDDLGDGNSLWSWLPWG